jgi:hypothetical protein
MLADEFKFFVVVVVIVLVIDLMRYHATSRQICWFSIDNYNDNDESLRLSLDFRTPSLETPGRPFNRRY